MDLQQFEYDVFLSYSSKDKPTVQELAERLKQDGLRVWFDNWVINPGDLIPLAIERGLERSRTLVLVMSKNPFTSEWMTLERQTVLFRDPTNQQRRFIPLRLDDSNIKDSLKQFAYLKNGPNHCNQGRSSIWQ
ncbi:MAG TPA: toll/interleukin-1 receptor domain-containing protein [Nitrospiraceae bacterium]